jgi:hypothetical protein
MIVIATFLMKAIYYGSSDHLSGNAMSVRPKIISLGAMDSGVEAALSQRFEVLREVEQGLDEIVAAHGDEIVPLSRAAERLRRLN